MNKFKAILLGVLIIGFVACKKDDTTPAGNDQGSSQPKSKWAIINDIWVLTDTYIDDMQKTSNGTGKYEFNKYGNFRTEINGVMQDIGTYKFTNSDSNYVSVLFNGTSVPSVWTIKQMDDHNLKVEFMNAGSRYNYNYKK